MTRADFFILIMFGVRNSREPIKGEFAKKLLAEVQKMMELKKFETFRNKDHIPKHNIIWKDES